MAIELDVIDPWKQSTTETKVPVTPIKSKSSVSLDVEDPFLPRTETPSPAEETLPMEAGFVRKGHPLRPEMPDISQAPALLAGQIMDLLPEILLFIISFLILAGFWLSHHRQFYFVRLSIPGCSGLTFSCSSLWFLYPSLTDIAGDYPHIFIAVLLFHTNIAIIGLIFSYHIFYITQSGHLCDPDTDRKFLQTQFDRSLLITMTAFIAAITGFLNPFFSLLVYLIIPVSGFFLYSKHK